MKYLIFLINKLCGHFSNSLKVCHLYEIQKTKVLKEKYCVIFFTPIIVKIILTYTLNI